MKKKVDLSVLLLAVAFVPHGAAQTPTPQEIVARACQAAGGLKAFQDLGFLRLQLSSSEVTQDGKTNDTSKVLIFRPDAIVPVRLEIPTVGVVAGDDGSGGWAVIGGRPDPRPSTTVLVRRMITADAFPLTMPFSLTWQGVTVTGVSEATLGNRPTWRLTVSLARNFFHSPQIATQWTVDIDKETYRVLRADSPYTDLGKGVVADGMRFSWSAYTTIGGVRLPTEQLVVGLDPFGNEKAHTRRDKVSWQTLSPDKTAGLFENPVPPEQRPRLPMGKPVNLPQPPKKQ